MFQGIVHIADIIYSLFITVQDPKIKLAPLSAGCWENWSLTREDAELSNWGLV